MLFPSLKEFSMPILELNDMKKPGFCKFYKNLYWGESIKKRTLVKAKLYLGKAQMNVFCVTRASMEQDQLDIINSAFLLQPYYKENPVMVYGIARGYSEALDIVMKISEEASAAGMDGRLLDYLVSNAG